MTLQTLSAALAAVCPDTYELAAPKGKLEYVVWAVYLWETVPGDDAAQLRAPKVQLDVVAQSSTAALFDSVMSALDTLHLPYDVISFGYDPEYAAVRLILQLVVA